MDRLIAVLSVASMRDGYHLRTIILYEAAFMALFHTRRMHGSLAHLCCNSCSWVFPKIELIASCDAIRRPLQ